ncbi:MAG: hypothetical protein ACK5LT_03400 [Lachnospirales bacterium]
MGIDFLINNKLNGSTNLKEGVRENAKLVEGKNITSIAEGKTTGEVLDVSNSIAKILTSSGQIVNGQLSNPTQLNIGDIRNFIINQNANGSYTFNIVQEDEGKLLLDTLTKALKDLGLTPTEKNISIAKELIKNSLPLNNSQFKDMSRAMALLGDSCGEKSAFLLKNEIPLNTKNANIFTEYVNKTFSVLNEINSLESAIKSMTDSSTKSKILDILIGSKNINSGIVKDILPKETVSAHTNQRSSSQILNSEVNLKQDSVSTKENSSVTNLVKENYTKENSHSNIAPKGNELTKVNVNNQDSNKTILNDSIKGGSTEPANVLKNISETIIKNTDLEDTSKASPEKSDSVNNKSNETFNKLKFDPTNTTIKDLEKFTKDFSNKIERIIEELKDSGDESSQKVLEQATSFKERLDFNNLLKENFYAQIPISVNNSQKNTELLVFKDKNKKKTNGGSASAIIGLDTLNLGRFETYVERIENNITLQFRLENNDIIDLVKSNLNKLDNLLKEKNLYINNVAYKNTKESFTIMSKNEDEIEIKSNNIRLDVRM